MGFILIMQDVNLDLSPCQSRVTTSSAAARSNIPFLNAPRSGLLGPKVIPGSSRGFASQGLMMNASPAAASGSLLARARGLPGLGGSGSLPQQLQKRDYGSEGHQLAHAYMLATDIMFWSGLIGGIVFRRNLIVLLLTTEVVMLACNLNFLFGAAYLNDMAVSEPPDQAHSVLRTMMALLIM